MQLSSIKMARKMKLTHLWVARILLAPGQENLCLPRRLVLNLRGFTGTQLRLFGNGPQTHRHYLSDMDWYRSRWINHPFHSMLNNKVVCALVLQPHVRVPETLFVKAAGHLSAANGVRDSLPAALEIIQERGDTFLRPLSRGGGAGVHRLQYAEGWYRLDGTSVTRSTLEELLRGEDNWFLSETLPQHEALAALHPDTVNTVRLITLRDPSSAEARPVFAALRVGTARSHPVDNAGAGGLVARINLQTGELSAARTFADPRLHTCHPETGARIAGVAIPHWEQLVSTAVDLMERFPYLHFVAWDFVVMAGGVGVVEANASSGVNIVQMWGPQRRGPLGEFYRHHGVIK